MNEERFRRAFLLLLVLGISAVFLLLIRQFLLTIFLAAIAAGLVYPLYCQLLERLGGRRPLASLLTMVLGIVILGGPFVVVIGMVTTEAMKVAQNIKPWIQQYAAEPTTLTPLLQRVPFAEYLMPYREQVLAQAAEFANSLGGMIVAALSKSTISTLGLVVNFFIFLYTFFFLLMDGQSMIVRIKHFIPIRSTDRDMLFGKFLSVARATIKGTLVIGVIQGGLSGMAFWVLGIPGAAFWGAVMVLLSVLPLLGGAIVWVPTAVLLALSGQFGKAIILTAFCGLVVGSVDNVLRPRLVGRDTQMHDLMILFSTLGGIMVFGPIGFIVGPIIAALFQSTWELFGAAYHDVLPEERPESAEGVVLLAAPEAVVIREVVEP